LNYRFESIRINQREIPLSAIRSGRETGSSAFEKATLHFIRQWLNGTETFRQQTSGSTGPPKEIIISRSQMAASAQRTLNALTITPGSTALVCLNPEYIAGKMMLVRALEFNLGIVAVEPVSDPLQHLPPGLQDVFAAFVPLQLQTMMGIPMRTGQLNRMKAILIGGAPVNEVLAKKIQKLQCPVYATYGMTETLSNIALQKLNGPDKQNYFKTLPGVTVKTDERNCLVIRLPEIAEPVVTKDVAELQADNSFRILGRFDNVINSGGIKIWPEQLEQRCEEVFHTLGINQPFFIGSTPHELLGEQVIMVIESDPLSHDVEAQLIGLLKKDLSPYEMPKQIRYATRFIVTASGKINRRATLKSIT
jgi:O-succinylbenzoic acid--CoA ligase